MTPRPSSGSFSDENYAAVTPILGDDESNGWQAAIYIAGVGVMYQPLHDFIRERPGVSSWGALLDPDLIPAEYLPWLGQWVGVRINSAPVEPALAERSQVKTHAGFARGTPASMIHDLAAVLTGTKHIVLRERWNGSTDLPAAYHLTVDTFDFETPNPDLALAAILGQKPGGIVLHYNIVPGPTWDESVSTWDDSIGAWDDVLDPN